LASLQDRLPTEQATAAISYTRTKPMPCMGKISYRTKRSIIVFFEGSATSLLITSKLINNILLGLSSPKVGLFLEIKNRMRATLSKIMLQVSNLG